jgi:undecaprenyl diphosphate synthase
MAMASDTMQTQSAPKSPPAPPERLPRHAAIIMDGNGRWAVSRGLERSAGHRAGAKSVRAVVTRAAELGLEALTLYGFSTENWARSADEVDCLMSLYVEFLVAERETMRSNNIRFMPIGRREGLPAEVLEQVDRRVEDTANNTGLTLALAINYGSRTEITDAVREISRRVAAGELAPEDIEPDTIDSHLYTAGLPDPDLLIRTAGEMRLSNYLLWQCSYSELYVSDACWPDFSADHFDDALRAYASRRRKFGKVL